eukprot:TRINITY_DN18594_c0_g1_i2.p1 TRINITY_DN18594_c0_g1~~TRINITY_DN18594_c0_g1_i2.p1  ORF type:complete len:376 (+),score=97.26 TRINITY_DN18594_c0_g1_i2:72-1130(+)
MAGPQCVIAGGGIVGAATAYYLSLRGVAATIVEQCAVACHSSGKAAGFLALDWNDSSPVGPLARKSFALHKELAEKFGAERIGYRALGCVGTGYGHQKRPPEGRWMDRTPRGDQMGTTQTVAQVHPRLLTEALVAAARERGARVVRGAVRGVELAGGRVCGVRVQGDGGAELIAATAFVSAVGAWTHQAAEWFPEAGLPTDTKASKYTAVLFRPRESVPAEAVFTSSEEHVEIYPRPDGEVYVCGCPEDAELPADPEAIVPDPAKVAAVRRVAASVSSCLEGDSAAHSCFLPGWPSGLPAIGPVPGVPGAFLGAGLTCWGILNGPATGLCLSEMVLDGSASSVDCSRFSLRR